VRSENKNSLKQWTGSKDTQPPEIKTSLTLVTELN